MDKAEKKSGFFKNHSDTIAIIGVNLAIATILLTMCLSNMSSVSCANARMDAANSRMDAANTAANARMDMLHTMFYDLLRETKK